MATLVLALAPCKRPTHTHTRAHTHTDTQARCSDPMKNILCTVVGTKAVPKRINNNILSGVNVRNYCARIARIVHAHRNARPRDLFGQAVKISGKAPRLD